MRFATTQEVLEKQRDSGSFRMRHRKKMPTLRRRMEKRLGVLFGQENTSVIFATGLLVFTILLALVEMWNSGLRSP